MKRVKSCPRIALATDADRTVIYRMRHAVYATELGQHPERQDGELRDDLDVENVYIVAWSGDHIAGFVSITLPGGMYSMDKYTSRTGLPFAFDEGLFEVRLLTVERRHRASMAAVLLMYAAVRWADSRGATRLMGIGRREVMGLYRRVGLRPLGIPVQSGAVHFEVMTVTRPEWRQTVSDFMTLVKRLESATQWDLDVPFHAPGPCFHGGAFYEAIGDGFDALDSRESVVNADVLDAWFPPSPGVIETLQEHLPWLARTSPPAGAEGLVRMIARTRGVPPASLLPGAGSSSLIYLTLRHWLGKNARALILDPTYGEYAHVLERVIGCQVDRFTLSRCEDYDVDLSRLSSRLSACDFAVIVNPNSPTGRHIPRESLEAALRDVPDRTRVWVDETYVEYAGQDQSLERFAVTRPNVVVCKSMSKVYALSGLRVAYLCATPATLEGLRALSPPWSVGLPAQVAAVRALEDPGYYLERYRETHGLRAYLAAGLRDLGLDVVPGSANFLLCHLPEAGPNAEDVVRRCRERGVFLRDASAMGTALGTHALRIASKGEADNRRVLATLEEVLDAASLSPDGIVPQKT